MNDVVVGVAAFLGGAVFGGTIVEVTWRFARRKYERP